MRASAGPPAPRVRFPRCVPMCTAGAVLLGPHPLASFAHMEDHTVAALAHPTMWPSPPGSANGIRGRCYQQAQAHQPREYVFHRCGDLSPPNRCEYHAVKVCAAATPRTVCDGGTDARVPKDLRSRRHVFLHVCGLRAGRSWRPISDAVLSDKRSALFAVITLSKLLPSCCCPSTGTRCGRCRGATRATRCGGRGSKRSSQEPGWPAAVPSFLNRASRKQHRYRGI